MQTGLNYIMAAAFAILLAQTALAQKSDPPRFEKYSADVYAGKPAPLNLRSHRLARMYRTSIREQLQEEGINFAGHYTVAVMGCGTGCSITAIVDARNGKAYFPRALNGWSVEPGIYEFKEDEDVRAFRANSRLLKIIGAPRLSADEKWRRAAFTTTNGLIINCVRCGPTRSRQNVVKPIADLTD